MFKSTVKAQMEATEIAASAREFREQVHNALAARLASRLREGETFPDLNLFQELLGRLLDSFGDQMREIDVRDTGGRVNTAALRAQRDELSARLRQQLRDVRYLVDRSIPSGAAKEALRDRRLSGAPAERLVQGARNLINTLRDPKLALDQLGEGGVFTSVSTIAANLEAQTNELDALLVRLTPERKSSQNQLGSKVTEVQAVVASNQHCAEILYGLLRLAGLDFHAERLRPKARRKRALDPEKAPPPAAVPSMALMKIN